MAGKIKNFGNKIFTVADGKVNSYFHVSDGSQIHACWNDTCYTLDRSIFYATIPETIDPNGAVKTMALGDIVLFKTRRVVYSIEDGKCYFIPRDLFDSLALSYEVKHVSEDLETRVG
jgi:hypothetical protein